MSPDDDAPEREPLDPDETSDPDDDPDDDGVPYGLDVLGAALDRQVSCPHGFDPQFCPFECA